MFKIIAIVLSMSNGSLVWSGVSQDAFPSLEACNTQRVADELQMYAQAREKGFDVRVGTQCVTKEEADKIELEANSKPA